MNRAPRGFTLIEVAIVTLVLTLLLGGLLIPLAAQVDQRRYAETNRTLAEIKQALIGFAQVNGRLPCPAKSDGTEQVAGCDTVYEGVLPWVTLNVPMTDAWGQTFRYAVSRELAKAVPPKLKFGTSTDLKIYSDTRGGPKLLADRVAAIVFSLGANGGRPIPAENANENENLDGSNDFVARARTAASAGCSDTTAGGTFCEFDDALVWISPFVLFTSMAEANQLDPE